MGENPTQKEIADSIHASTYVSKASPAVKAIMLELLLEKIGDNASNHLRTHPVQVEVCNSPSCGVTVKLAGSRGNILKKVVLSEGLFDERVIELEDEE